MKKQDIAIPIHATDEKIHGTLTLVPQSTSLVIFAHGSGSSRFSTRNQFVADLFNRANISTFLFDLLTEREEAIDQFTREFRFNTPLLASRLVLVTQWLKEHSATKELYIGYFGASTGAAAALIAAAELPEYISAVVSRGGRPDLAATSLHKILCPTLLIIGALDYEVIELNNYAYEQLSCIKEIKLIPGATHLFEEDNTLEQAADAARDWFKKYLGGNVYVQR